ncbi:MAG: hypothetical protein DMF62_17975 [Acidobacteria bacterium]|nr:MAG: hypothetical protein DMF62_17975 [Acidobacteriota bacterium]
MNSVIKSRSFWIGFVLGIALLLAVNLGDAIVYFDKLCFDCEQAFGFPFKLYESGTFVRPKRIIWEGVLGNAAATSAISIVFGLAIYFLTQKFGNKKFR